MPSVATRTTNDGEAGLSVLSGTGAREREASRGERGEGEGALGISLARGEGWGRMGQCEAGGGVRRVRVQHVAASVGGGWR